LLFSVALHASLEAVFAIAFSQLIRPAFASLISPSGHPIDREPSRDSSSSPTLQPCTLHRSAVPEPVVRCSVALLASDHQTITAVKICQVNQHQPLTSALCYPEDQTLDCCILTLSSGA
jgi:hypothetical protein